jgi:urease accessory protein
VAVADLGASGGTRLAVLRSQAPLVLRPAGGAVWLVGAAAGPLGGDDLSLEIEVGPGAELTVRTAAASVALPGGDGRTSRFEVRAEVAEGGVLRWLPEPGVAAAGCRHEASARVRVADGGRLEWREEVVLGRWGEEPGAWRSRLVVDAGGRPLLRQELRLGPGPPGWDGPAVVGPARVVGSLLVVDPSLDGFDGREGREAVPVPPEGHQVGRFPLAPGAMLVTALGPAAPAVRRALLDALRG